MWNSIKKDFHKHYGLIESHWLLLWVLKATLDSSLHLGLLQNFGIQFCFQLVSSKNLNSELTLITGSADNSFLYLFKVYKNSKNLCIWYGNNQLQNQLHKKARKCYTNKMIFHKLFQGKVLSLVILAAFKIIYCSSLQLPKYRKNIKN